MKNKIILVGSSTFGQGDENLGSTLLETFFTILKQKEEKPIAIFFLNSGVELVTNESFCSLHLEELESVGVRILACTTCLNHYGLAEKQVAGNASTMAEFVNLSSEYEVMTL